MKFYGKGDVFIFSSWHGILHWNLANDEPRGSSVVLGHVPSAGNNRRSQWLRCSFPQSLASHSGIRRRTVPRFPPLQLCRQLFVDVYLVGLVARNRLSIPGTQSQAETRKQKSAMKIRARIRKNLCLWRLLREHMKLSNRLIDLMLAYCQNVRYVNTSVCKFM